MVEGSANAERDFQQVVIAPDLQMGETLDGLLNAKGLDRLSGGTINVEAEFAALGVYFYKYCE